MTETGLIIGRFNPCHLGHKGLFDQLIKHPGIKDIVIAIGSAQYERTMKNPFTVSEREMMIRASVDTEKPIRIVGIEDKHDDVAWANEIKRQVGEFGYLLSGNDWVRRCLKDFDFQTIEPIQKYDISATMVRAAMIKGEDWKSLVPEVTRRVIEQIDGVNIMRQIHNRYINPSVTVDVIVRFRNRILLIQRGKDPFKGAWALPGGHLETNKESVRKAAERELFEETGIVARGRLRFMNYYDEPNRDPRSHYISFVFTLDLDEEEEFVAGDDAVAAKFWRIDDLPRLAFDHKDMIDFYLMQKQS